MASEQLEAFFGRKTHDQLQALFRFFVLGPADMGWGGWGGGWAGKILVGEGVGGGEKRRFSLEKRSERPWPLWGRGEFLRGLWSDITGEIADVHIRTDANNLVTTASTTHQLEQKETMHLIQMLRKGSNSGQMHDLAHVRSEDCLADSLTKHSAKADELIKAVLTGNLLNVDAHPAFRTMLQNKAFLVEWLARNTKHGPDIIAFAGVGMGNLGMIRMSTNSDA